MTFFDCGKRACLVFLFALSAACGGGGDDGGGGNGPPPPGNTGIGAAGGTVTEPSGAKVVIPAGALTTDTAIAVAQSSAGAPPLPSGVTAFGNIYAFTPHGTTFAVPVTITVPFDPAQVPAGTTPVLYKTNAAMTGWAEVTGATVDGATMSGQASGFSFLTVASPIESDPGLTEKHWALSTFDQASDEDITVLEDVTQVGGEVKRQLPIGNPLILAPAGQPLPEAVLEVFSNDSGKTFWTVAEAPHDDEVNTGVSELTQTFTFKRPPGAVSSLKFVLSSAFMEAVDGGGAAPSIETCPWLDSTLPPDEIRTTCADFMMHSEIRFKLRATKVLAPDSFFSIAGIAHLTGAGSTWNFDAHGVEDFTGVVWTKDDFTQTIVDSHALVELNTPFTVIVPLDGNVGDNELFTVEIELFSGAEDRVQGESFASAFIRDPLSSKGLDMTVSGLEQVPVQHPVLVEPEAEPCQDSADPAAGTLQFSATEFRAPELQRGGTVLVERVGGTTGDVSVLLETADGTALDGSDYESIRKVVRFADGQGGVREVTIPFVLDKTAEPDETVKLKLSMFSGCAALGARPTATLLIQDDDRPLPGSVTTLDPSFGSGGKVTTAFGGKRTAMALQPDGKIVMVGGSITDFLLARYNADGSLDTSFGSSGGTITTDIGAFTQEEARAVALQPDGKIVVAGNVRVSEVVNGSLSDHFFFTLVRYNADGSLDSSFGGGGKVKSEVLGSAFAVALRSDGKMVAAGDDALAGGTVNMKLARFNADGTLDTSFGVLGSVTTDVTADVDGANNMVLLSDGSIIASGSPVGGSSTGVAKYLENGTPDGNFGTFGAVALEGALVGQGLARQSDGKLVLVGSKQVGVGNANVTQFELRRLNADGSVDPTFGNGGIVNTAFSTSLDSAAAITLRGDGKLLVSGQSAGFKFVLARYNTDGTLDATFGPGGKVQVTFAGEASAENVVIQPDGKLLLGGFAGSTRTGYALARFNP